MSNEKRGCPKGGKGIGGQAVIEGVMMRGKKMYALAVRNPQNKIEVVKNNVKVYSEKCRVWGWPIIRGVVSFVDSLVLGMKIIMKSAEMAGLDQIESEEEEEPSKFEKFLERKFGDKLSNYIIYLSVFVSIILCIGIFMVLPVWIGSLFKNFVGITNARYLGIIEGFIRIIIFLGYILLTAQLKDVKRVFMYHGAEHKTINCFESDDELTVENVRKHTRLHKRCGTSFLFLVMIVSMIVFLLLDIDTVWIRVVSRILLVPFIAGISYEIIKWAGRNDNLLVKIVSAPGLALQLVTTKEPDDSMIEVAIASLKGVLEDEPQDCK